MTRFLYWAPRLIGLGFAVFLSLFAADVLAEPAGVGRKVVAFAIHLLPAAIVVGMTLVAWQRPVIGSLLFTLAALAYIVAVAAAHHPVSWMVLIAGPLLLVGLLFVLGANDARRLTR